MRRSRPACCSRCCSASPTRPSTASPSTATPRPTTVCCCSPTGQRAARPSMPARRSRRPWGGRCSRRAADRDRAVAGRRRGRRPRLGLRPHRRVRAHQRRLHDLTSRCPAAHILDRGAMPDIDNLAEPRGAGAEIAGGQPETMEERIRRAEVLVEALPYIKRFAGHTVVIKLGGAAIESGDPEPVLQDVTLLRFVGMRPVLVHGGGPAISAWQKRLGVEARFVNGLRVTDAQTMELAKMVLTGKIGPELVSTINRLGVEAFGMSGGDGPTLLVKPRPA